MVKSGLAARAVLLALVLFEGLVTILAPHRDWPLNAIGFGVLGSGFAVGAALWWIGRLEVLYPLQLQRPRFRHAALVCLALLAPVGWLVAHKAAPLLSENPIDAAASDVIPTIQVMVRRLLAGSYPYTVITDFGYTLPATYLPMQWLPYTLAEVFRFDYRFVAFALFGIGTAWVGGRAARQAGPTAGLLIGGLLLLLFYLLTKEDPGILTMTVEVGVAGYYLLLVAGIGGRSAWLCGVAIALCLLSRYSLVLWLPLWAAVEWTEPERQRAGKATGIAAALVLLLYVLPFLSQDWGSFWRGYKYYDLSALGEWQRLNDKGQPYHLYHGFGAARFFHEGHADWTVADRLRSLQKWHLAVSLGSVMAMAVLWFTALRRRIDRRLFLLGSFKIYLTVFLFFIQVPYPYLMIVGTAVSVALLGESFRRGNLTEAPGAKGSFTAFKPRIFQKPIFSR